MNQLEIEFMQNPKEDLQTIPKDIKHNICAASILNLK